MDINTILKKLHPDTVQAWKEALELRKVLAKREKAMYELAIPEEASGERNLRRAIDTYESYCVDKIINTVRTQLTAFEILSFLNKYVEKNPEYEVDLSQGVEILLRDMLKKEFARILEEG